MLTNEETKQKNEKNGNIDRIELMESLLGEKLKVRKRTWGEGKRGAVERRRGKPKVKREENHLRNRKKKGETEGLCKSTWRK